METAIDGRCLAFTAALAIVVAVLFGLIPALRASRPNLADAFKDEGPTSTPSRSSRRLNHVVVAAQVALALVLTLSAALTTKTLVDAQHVELGFLPDGLLTARIDLPDTKYPDIAARTQLSQALLQRLATLPGVRAAAVANSAPLQHEYDEATFAIEGKPAPDAAHKPVAKKFVVSPAYFSTMEIAVKAGRAFDDRDREDGPPVVIISQRLAELRFGNEDPVGKFIDIAKEGRREIVGVVGNVHDGYRRDQGFLYLPYAQAATRQVALILRADRDVQALTGPLREQVRRIDPQQPVTQLLDGPQIVQDSLLAKRLMTQLFIAIAFVALLLASVGIYGVVAFTVGQRRHELSIRSALGATRRDLLALVLREAMTVVVAGIVVGLPLSVLSVQGVSRALDAPPGVHGAVWLGAMLFMLSVAFFASWLPSSRAIRES